MNIRSFIYFLLFLVLVSSCKKKDENYYIQDSFKEWTLYKQGSYWIYLNEGKGKLDSTFISQAPDDFLSHSNEDNHNYEIITYVVDHIGQFGIRAYTNNSELFLKDLYTDGATSLSYMVTAALSDHVTTNCGVINRYDALIVNNNKFTNVIHTRDSSYYSIKDYYYAMKIGLIKYSLKTTSIDSTWSLIRWHVVQ